MNVDQVLNGLMNLEASEQMQVIAISLIMAGKPQDTMVQTATVNAAVAGFASQYHKQADLMTREDAIATVMDDIAEITKQLLDDTGMNLINSFNELMMETGMINPA